MPARLVSVLRGLGRQVHGSAYFTRQVLAVKRRSFGRPGYDIAWSKAAIHGRTHACQDNDAMQDPRITTDRTELDIAMIHRFLSGQDNKGGPRAFRCRLFSVVSSTPSASADS